MAENLLKKQKSLLLFFRKYCRSRKLKPLQRRLCWENILNRENVVSLGICYKIVRSARQKTRATNETFSQNLATQDSHFHDLSVSN